jgi:hypothetical protein
LGKYPSHNIHLIVGKITEDSRDTGASPPPELSTGCSSTCRGIHGLIFIAMGERLAQKNKRCHSLEVKRLAVKSVIWIF